MSELIPIPCRTCGAPMSEAERGALYGRTKMVCGFCGKHEELPEEPSERVRALRQRLAQISWAVQAVEGPAVGVARAIEGWKTMALPATLVVAGVPLLMFALRLLQSSSLHAADLLQMGFAPLTSVGLVVGLQLGSYLALRGYERDLRPSLLAFAPTLPGEAGRCRCCGGTLPGISRTAMVTCGYCSATNLVTVELAARAAADLDRELAVHRDRAAGMPSQIAAASQRCTRRMYLAAALGMAVTCVVSGSSYWILQAISGA